LGIFCLGHFHNSQAWIVELIPILVKHGDFFGMVDRKPQAALELFVAFFFLLKQNEPVKI